MKHDPLLEMRWRRSVRAGSPATFATGCVTPSKQPVTMASPARSLSTFTTIRHRRSRRLHHHGCAHNGADAHALFAAVDKVSRDVDPWCIHDNAFPIPVHRSRGTIVWIVCECGDGLP